MTTTMPAAPRTVAELVRPTADGSAPPDRGDPGRPLARLQGGLSTVGRSWLRRQVVTELNRILGEDLTEVLVRTWAGRQQLARAAADTAHQPSAERLVVLAEHQATYAQDLTITVSVDGQPLPDVRGRAALVYDVGRVEATVRGGYLVDVACGHCQVTGTLELEGNLIARRPMPIPVGITLHLRRPIDLAHRSAPDQLHATHS